MRVAVGLALVSCLVAVAQEVIPPDVREVATELALEEEERQRFAADVAWARAERQRLVARLRSGELDFAELGAELDGLRDALRERLAASLTPAQLAALDLDDLLRGPPDPVRVKLEARTSLMPSLPLLRGGRVGEWASSVELGLEVPLTHTVTLTFGVEGSERVLDFHRAFELDPQEGDPFGQVHGARVSLGAQLRLGPVFVIGSLSGQVAAEDGAKAEDALTVGGFAAVSYAFSRSFSLGLGVLVRSRIEEQVQVLPLPLIRLDLELSERWRLKLGAPDGLQLSFRAHETLVATLGIGFLGGIAQDLRLDDEGFAPEGVARGRRIPARLELRWTPVEGVSAGLEVGVFLWQRVQIDDRRGHSLTDDRTDPAPFGALSLRLEF